MSSLQSFSLSVLKWQKVFGIQIIFYVTGQKIKSKESEALDRYKEQKEEEKAVSVFENDSEKILQQSQATVKWDWNKQKIGLETTISKEIITLSLILQTQFKK